MAQKTFNNTKINVNFEETSSRQQINSGENISILFGKIKKFFSDLKSVAFSGSYNDLSDTPTIPSVGNGTITITQNGVEKGTFSVNQSDNKTIELSDEIASNPNLLINPDFAVNQRGITSASGGTSTVYIADRWYSQRAIISRPENGGISIAWDGTNKDNGWVQQKIETAALFGKTVTISADIAGERKSVTTTVPTLVNKTGGDWVDSDKKVMLTVSNLGGTLMSVAIFSYTTTPIAVSNVKLELGAAVTQFYPPDPATELAKCQRYYQIRSTGNIAAVDMRPSMRTITDIKQRSDGNYEYIAEL